MGRLQKHQKKAQSNTDNHGAPATTGIHETSKPRTKDAKPKQSAQLREMRKILGRVKRPKMVARPKTPWIFFLTRSYRKHKDSGGNTPFKQFWTELSPIWKQLDPAEKSEYVQFHEEDKVRYENEMKNLNEEDIRKIDTYKRYCKLKKAVKKGTTPKPVITNYMAFARLERPKIRQETPNITFGELGKVLGKRWKNASAEMVAHCNQIVSQDRERYRTEMEMYNKEKGNEGDDGTGEESQVGN
jgi:hypothetical protein